MQTCWRYLSLKLMENLYDMTWGLITVHRTNPLSFLTNNKRRKTILNNEISSVRRLDSRCAGRIPKEVELRRKVTKGQMKNGTVPKLRASVHLAISEMTALTSLSTRIKLIADPVIRRRARLGNQWPPYITNFHRPSQEFLLVYFAECLHCQKGRDFRRIGSII